MKNESHFGNSLLVQWLGLSAFTARPGLIPRWGTKMPASHEVWPRKKERKKKNEPHLEKIWKVTGEKSDGSINLYENLKSLPNSPCEFTSSLFF